jgi:hypothetical protein
MGFNATVVVLLDQLDRIEKDPEFGKKLAQAIRYRSMVPRGPNEKDHPGYRPLGDEATGQTQVIEVHHADYQVVVAVGGNSGQVLGHGGSWRAEPDDMIKWLNDDRLRRRREAKKSAAEPATL